MEQSTPYEARELPPDRLRNLMARYPAGTIFAVQNDDVNPDTGALRKLIAITDAL